MTTTESLKALALSLNAPALENEPMTRHTTFKIGGPADLFITPKDAKTMAELCAFCRENSVPCFVIGNGSNLLVSDKGVRGAVIRCAPQGSITVEGTAVESPAGISLSAVCEAARENGLSGLEFAYGIPGSVGGAVYMNAGAYGGEIKDVVSSTSHLDGGKIGGFDREHLDFGYRRSAYTEKGLVVTRVRFELSRGDKAAIGEKMRELLERRRSKQPLEMPSAGSVFKRPEGHFAGTLIEQCGLKGRQVGGAMVSAKHAGFIVNAGGATCRDVLELVDIIKNTVAKKTGVALECEIRVAGEA